jgi:hypothetical protein
MEQIRRLKRSKWNKNIFYISVWGVMLLSCQSNKNVKPDFDVNDSLAAIEQNVSQEEKTDINDKTVNITETTCDSVIFDEVIYKYESEILEFYGRNENILLEEIALWKQKTDSAKMVKTLRLKNIENLPNDLKIFSNVEIIFLSKVKNIKELSMFKKLKRCYFYDIEAEFPTDLSQTNLEFFSAEKSNIEKFNRIFEIKTLKEIVMNATQLDEIADNFFDLPNLFHFEIGNYHYNGKNLNLEELNFSNNECLKILIVESKSKNIFSIPQGIQNHNFLHLQIRHPNLTESEKSYLKSLGNIDKSL